MKAALYIRVSTEEQAKHGLSLEEQKHDLMEYCKDKHYEVFDTYKDDGISAHISMSKRPELQRLIQDVKNHQIIQIPHHGRLDHAEELFEIKKGDKDTVFLISDNKGKSSGGSEELIKSGKDKGHVIYNTRTEETKRITGSLYQKSYRVGSYI